MTPPLRERPTRSPVVGRRRLLGTALLQAVAPALIGFREDAGDPPIVPPGRFFAVWGVIVLVGEVHRDPGGLDRGVPGLGLDRFEGHTGLPSRVRQVCRSWWQVAWTSPALDRAESRI